MKKRYWASCVHTGGLSCTRPEEVFYQDRESPPSWRDESGLSEYWKLGLHKDGPNSHVVSFVSENRDEVVIWMKGVAACMATIHEWSSLGCGELEAADHFADLPEKS